MIAHLVLGIQCNLFSNYKFMRFYIKFVYDEILLLFINFSIYLL